MKHSNMAMKLIINMKNETKNYEIREITKDNIS